MENDTVRPTLRCIGVGPGDPELMTLKAVRLIREADAAAVPGREPRQSLAYRIAVQAVPELAEKELLGIPMPMSADPSLLEEEHRAGAETLLRAVEGGKRLVYLTLGDPTVYCSFSYLHPLLEKRGCAVEYVSGVTSFCAAAARLGLPLAEGEEALHILPAAYRTEGTLDRRGSYVLMKSGTSISAVKALLRRSGREAAAVSGCGLPGEAVYRSLAELPDDAGYFTLILSKDHHNP